MSSQCFVFFLKNLFSAFSNFQVKKSGLLYFECLFNWKEVYWFFGRGKIIILSQGKLVLRYFFRDLISLLNGQIPASPSDCRSDQHLGTGGAGHRHVPADSRFAAARHCHS